MQTVALIDYGSGNLRSVERALLASAARANRRREVRITADPEFVWRADRIVLPGQGAFADCMGGLLRNPELHEAIAYSVKKRAIPFLGICVGMQLMVELGQEHTQTKGLGWLPGVCRKLQVSTTQTLPHMGWNKAAPTRAHPVLAALDPAAHVYFAHSFVVEVAKQADIAAVTTHGETFASAIAKDAMVGVQFHPEKSQATGLTILAAFLDWNPA